MIQLRSQEEVDKVYRACQILAETRAALAEMIEPGVTTLDLDRKAEDMIKKLGAKPAFKGYRGFPGCICVSLNDEVVHGIPSKRKMKDGDILGLDMGTIYDGYFGDSAMTFGVGNVSDEAARLMKVTEESLYRGIDAAVDGGHLQDIGASVQEHAEAAGFSVVRDFVGHGIGTSLHEDPQVPNFGKRGRGLKLRAGMVLAIEPMINVGRKEVRVLDDGWTAVTQDGSLSAHFEHTIAITESGPKVLSRLGE